MNCPFLIMPICRFTVTHQKRTKWKVNGSAYFNKIDRFIELHFIRGELFMELCRDSCEETEELGSDLCLWCCNDRWLRPPTGEFLNPLILRITVTTGMFLSARTYDEWRAQNIGRLFATKVSKRLEDKSISQENPDSIKAFSAKFFFMQKKSSPSTI